MGLSIDQEKVIKGLKKLQRDLGYGLPDRSAVVMEYLNSLTDAISLLKEQEPIKPTINEDGEAYCVCGENVGIIPNSKDLPKIRSKYCPECGRRMEWDLV